MESKFDCYARFNRRQALALLGRGLGAGLLAAGDLAFLTAFGQTGGRSGAPSAGLLKRRIKSRTFNAHTHITGLSRSLAPNFSKTEPKPFDPKMTVTEEERREAITYWTRFKHGILEWDSKEQEDIYVRKYIHLRRHPLREPFEDRAERFLKQMDEAGIDTSILLLLDFMRPQAAVGTEGDVKGERIEPMLQATQELCKRHPGRFIPFVAIDVRRGKDGVRFFELAVKQYGFKGYGELVGTLWQTKPNNRELCYPFFEKALELGVPVMIDATMDRGFSETQIFEDILKDFPRLKVCAGGAGIRVNPVEQNGKTVSAPDRMLQLAEKHANLFLDLDDWQVADQKGMRKYLDYLRRALDGPAKNRIMFGSDFPVFEWMYTEKEWIEFVLKHVDRKEIKFSQQELELFFSKNALGYLGLKS